MTNQDNGVWLDHDSGGPNALVTRESNNNELIGSSITISTLLDYVGPCDVRGIFWVLDLVIFFLQKR